MQYRKSICQTLVPMNTQFIIITVYSYSSLSNIFFKCVFNPISCLLKLSKSKVICLPQAIQSFDTKGHSSWNTFYPCILQNKSLIFLNCRQFLDNCLSWILLLWLLNDRLSHSWFFFFLKKLFLYLCYFSVIMTLQIICT